jgi:hypothetical protein
MSEVVIVLEGERPMSWNRIYAGINHHARAKEVDAVHWHVRAVIPEGTIPFASVVDIHITAEMTHPVIDSDNIPGKLYIDGLKANKDDEYQPHVIHDDSPKWVRRVTTEAVKAKENKVTIRVVEVES